VANDKPDGYTLLSSSNSANVVAPAIHLNTPDSISDFKVIGQYETLNSVLPVNANAKWEMAKALFEFAKNNPKELDYGTGGRRGNHRHVLRAFQEGRKNHNRTRSL
jgi:tripartite-type tricarboxylate transporter receptor subunit TctC